MTFTVYRAAAPYLMIPSFPIRESSLALKARILGTMTSADSSAPLNSETSHGKLFSPPRQCG